MYLFALLGVLAASYFFYQALQRPSPAVIIAGVVWLLYGAYEFLIGNGVLCDANCNIRVDLIVFWPLLAIATLYGCNTPGQTSVAKKVLGVIGIVLFVLLAAPLVYIALVGFPEETPTQRGSPPSPK
jgi:hypothetical protein